MINKLPVLILLDTGSAVSVLSKELADLLKLKITNVQASCCSVTSQPVKVVGQVKVNVKVENFSWPHLFLVCERLSCPVIVGADFIVSKQLHFSLPESNFWFRFLPHKIFRIVWRPNVTFNWQAKREKNPLLLEIQCSTANNKSSFSLDHLSAERSNLVQGIISEFDDVITERLGLTNILEYEIILNDTKPVRLPPFRMNPPRMQILKEKIEDMLEKDIIRPSRSPYSSPIFLVPKGEQNFRPVIDYRVLNTKISIDSIPLPDVQNCFHWFAKAKYFTSIDLNSAYHQIPLAESSKKFTAFTTDWNLYEFNRVPFGIAIGAQVLTRLLDIIFGDIKFKYLFNYLDDVVIYSETFEDHLDHLKEVFSRLRQAGLTVNPDKVSLVSSSLSFLGHIISPSGVIVNPDRTLKIRQFAEPKNVKQVARFIGMVNYFRKFIPEFSRIAEPLNNLRKKDVKFRWEEAQQEAFDSLKRALISPPVLAVPNFQERFILQTDASATALAAVLLQESSGSRRAVAYASRTLTFQERKYSTYELEALAVLFGTEKFKFYLEHSEFSLETDNKALSWVLSRPRKTGRIARWAVRLSAFKFTVQHIKGVDNSVADALSRMYEMNDDGTNEGNQVESPTIQVSGLLAEIPLAFSHISQHQANDPSLANIIEQLNKGIQVSHYTMKDGVLCCKSLPDKKWKIVVPEILVPTIFAYFHSSPAGSHNGIFKTRHRIREKFIWKGMDADIRTRVRACAICAMSKPAQKSHYGLLSSSVASRPMEKIFIDFKGRLPRTSAGHAYILVCVDAFSKFVWLFPLREATTASTIKCLKSIFASFGVPKVLVSDNAKQFTSNVFSRFCFDSSIQHVTTVPYYPNPSQAERVNRNLRSALIAYHSERHTSWDTKLHWLQHAFNTAKHEAHNTTPFSLMMAFQPNCPLSNLWSLVDLLPDNSSPKVIQEKWKEAFNNLKRRKARLAQSYNKQRLKVPYKVGDSVMLLNHPVSAGWNKFAAKLAPRFIGPFLVDKFTSPVTLLLRDHDGLLRRAHVSQLKPA